MARIPYQGLPQVDPSGQGAPMPRNVQPGGFDALTRGAQHLGVGMGSQLEKAAAEYDRRAEESRKKAIEGEVTEAETLWSRYRTERKYGRRGSGSASQDAGDAAFTGEPAALPGYFNLKGDEAFQAGPATFEAIEKRRQALADEMADEDARHLFLTRTRGHLDVDRQQIEEYAGKQRQVADVATLKAREASALEAIQADPGNFVEVSSQTAALEEGIRRFGLSDADKQADVNDWRRRAAVAQVAAQLSGDANRAPDWEAAEKTLASKRATIGEEAAAKLQAAIEKQKYAGEAEQIAANIVSTSMNEKGDVNQAAALRQLAEVPAEKQKAVRLALTSRVTEAEQAYAAATKRISTASFSAYNKVGARFFATELADELNERNPELYNRLENDARAELERLERKKRGTAEDRRAQTATNNTARNLFLAMPVQQQAQTDVDQFLAGRGVDEETRTAIMVDRRKASDVTERGQSVALTQFVDEATASASSFLAPKSSSKQDRDAAREAEEAFRARATDAWMRKREEKKGVLPNTEETRALVSDLVKPMPPTNARQAAQSATAIVDAANQRVQVLPELDFTDTPPIRKVVKYKRSPDGSRRVPVYDDGSFGPEELVR